MLDEGMLLRAFIAVLSSHEDGDAPAHAPAPTLPASVAAALAADVHLSAYLRDSGALEPPPPLRVVDEGAGADGGGDDGSGEEEEDDVLLTVLPGDFCGRGGLDAYAAALAEAELEWAEEARRGGGGGWESEGSRKRSRAPDVEAPGPQCWGDAEAPVASSGDSGSGGGGAGAGAGAMPAPSLTDNALAHVGALLSQRRLQLQGLAEAAGAGGVAEPFASTAPEPNLTHVMAWERQPARPAV